MYQPTCIYVQTKYLNNLYQITMLYSSTQRLNQPNMAPNLDSPQLRPPQNNLPTPTFPGSTLIDSIVNNSIIPSLQNSSRNPSMRYDVKPQQQFCRFAQIQNNKINLIEQGLEVLDQYDYVSILTLEGDFRKLPPLVNSATGEELRPVDNYIWISKSPIFSFNLKKYIVLLRIIVRDQIALGLAHSFCCMISNMVIIGNYNRTNLKYLTQPLRFISNNTQNSGGDIRNKYSLLCGLNQDQAEPFPRQLQKQGIEKQLRNMHRFIGTINSPNIDRMQNILNGVQSQLAEEDKNDLLNHGEIVVSYAENLAKQYNRQGVFRPSVAQNDIQVEQGFEQYLSAVNNYNSKCKSTIGSQSQSDFANQLQRVRLETQQQNIFRNNPYYSSKLAKHMDRKQKQLSQINQQFNDVYNLNILQQQGQRSLKAATSNKGWSKTQLSTQLDRLTKRYNDKSRGNNRQKLLTEFLQVFVPTYYQQAGIFEKSDVKLKQLSTQNKKLEDQLKKYQEKKKSKGCCQIM